MRFILTFTACLLALATPAVAEVPRLVGSLGQQLGASAPEAYLRYVGTPYFWKLQPVLGASIASTGSGWVGAGSAVTWRAPNSGLFARASLMAGVHRKGAGPDLGGLVLFRSAIDLGKSDSKVREYGVGADHRSSGGLYKPNPGLNTAYLFMSVPLR